MRPGRRSLLSIMVCALAEIFEAVRTWWELEAN